MIRDTMTARTMGPLAAAALAVLTPACADMDVEGMEAEDMEAEGVMLEGKTQELYMAPVTKWPNGQVPVCWSIDKNRKANSTAPVTTMTTEQKRRVRDIAAASWPAVAKVDFTGWADCTSTDPKGVVELIVMDVNWGGGASGGYNGQNGWHYVQLPIHRGDLWDGFVPHEFGHLLGFNEEVARADIPTVAGFDACKGGGAPGDTLGTIADNQSVMASTGYCNNNSALSHWDRVGVQKAYGARGPSTYMSWRSQAGSVIPQTDANFEFEVASNGDLFVIKKNATRSGLTEVQIVTASSGYKSFGLQTATAFGQNTNKVDWMVGPNRDLYAIVKFATGTRSTEVHVLSAASGYRSYTLQTGTGLHETNDDWEFELANNRDLFAIKKRATGSGKTEVHVLTAASNYQNFVTHAATAIAETGANVTFALDPASRDLYAIAKNATGTRSTEVHVMPASANYASYSLQTGTALLETGDEFAFVLMPNLDVLGVKRGTTATRSTELHRLAR